MTEVCLFCFPCFFCQQDRRRSRAKYSTRRIQDSGPATLVLHARRKNNGICILLSLFLRRLFLYTTFHGFLKAVSPKISVKKGKTRLFLMNEGKSRNSPFLGQKSLTPNRPFYTLNSALTLSPFIQHSAYIRTFCSYKRQ